MARRTLASIADIRDKSNTKHTLLIISMGILSTLLNLLQGGRVSRRVTTQHILKAEVKKLGETQEVEISECLTTPNIFLGLARLLIIISTIPYHTRVKARPTLKEPHIPMRHTILNSTRAQNHSTVHHPTPVLL
jgi:hypothetical protein